MKLIVGVFLLLVGTMAGLLACLSGSGMILSVIVSFEHADCMLGVFLWGLVFIVSAPIALGSFWTSKSFLGFGRDASAFEALSEISGADELTLRQNGHSKSQFSKFRPPNGWQTGLIISVILFAIGFVWKFAN